MKSKFLVNLDKKQTRYKQGGKNKKIRKKMPLPNQKQNFHLRTSTSIIYDSEMQELDPDPITMRQYKKQLNFIKNYMGQVFSSYEFAHQKFLQQINSFKKNLSFQVISIDKLFDQQNNEVFTGSYISHDLYDYLKLLNNQLQQKRKKIILKTPIDTFLLTQQSKRRQDDQQFKGQFIDSLEREVFQYRQNFMEKIQINQSKYQNCNSQLSQNSQEMLFLSKIYMANCSKIQKLRDSIALKMSNSFSEPYVSIKKQYFEVVMKKNIAYAFKDQQLDFLNYFRQKECERNNFWETSLQINNQTQFFDYLKTKKPKKSKLAKYGLPTACSCCFSDYVQSYNPFVTCESCNLRCHELCFNLKQKACGNCSYQRLLKSQKQIVPQCIICQQKGQMVIKLENKVYAHGFCLLVHNMWKVQPKKVLSQHQKGLQNELQTFYTNLNPYLKNQKASDKKNQLGFLQNPQIENFQKTLDEYPKEVLNKEKSLRSVQEQKLLDDIPEKREDPKCQICSQEFHCDLHIECFKCAKKFHAFCAFFDGFDFKCLNLSHQQSKVNILVDCCSKSCSEKQDLKKKRSFILNRNRFLFQNI